MPASCVVGGCTRKTTKNPEVHFVRFPRNPSTCKEWVRFVDNTRSDFKLTKWSTICSAHFKGECVDDSVKLQGSMGLKPKFRLKPGSVPSLKAPSTSKDDSQDAEMTQPAKHVGAAFKKRQKSRILQEALDEYNIKYGEPSSVRPESSSTEQVFSAGLEIIKDTDVTVPHPDAPSSEPDRATIAVCPMTTTAGIDQSTQTAARWRCSIHHIASSQINILPRDAHHTSVRSKRTQTKPKMFHPVNKGVQVKRLLKCENKFTECSIVKGKPLQKLQRSTHTVTQPAAKAATFPEEPVSDDPTSEPVCESDYVPSSHDSADTSTSSDEEKITYDVVDDSKYIVFRSSLLQLFQKCHKCDAVAKVTISRPLSGTLIKVLQICRKRGCGQIKTWRSQPMIGNIAAGNLLLSAACLTSGCSPKKFLRALTSLNIATISYESFFNHQKWFLQPAISHVWKTSQELIVQDLRSRESGAFLGTDMRADSMGHSAKYGCYSTLEMNVNKVLHIEVVQKNEVGNKSNLMEIEGLIRTLMWVDNAMITVSAIVTDRHRQIAKHIREKVVPTSGVKHYYDVWHVAKGLKKKLVKISKLSGCGVIQPWIQSIINNIYWVAASTQDGDKELMLAKFDSVHNHLLNIHTHDNPIFQRCAHGPLPKREWLQPGTKPAQEVGKVLGSIHIRKDIQMLSPSMQTSSVEAFHSVITHFAPKMYGYSFEGMLCRIYLAALHYNENAGRRQSKTAKGALRYNIVFPRSKQDTGGYTVQKVMVKSTYDYVNRVIKKAALLCQERDKTSREMYPQLVCNPGPISSTRTRPDKTTAVNTFVSRFSKITQPVARTQPVQELAIAASQGVSGTDQVPVKARGKRKKGPENMPQSTTRGKRGKKTK